MDSVGAYYRADDLAFAKVFSDCNVLNKEKTKELQRYADCVVDICCGYFIDKVCVVLRKPTVVLNDAVRLHSETQPAVYWESSKGFYYLNGIKFEKNLWERVVSRTMKFDEILDIEDVDQRTIAMQYGDMWEFLKHVKGVEIDTYTKYRPDGGEVKYWLYKVPQGDVYSKDVWFNIMDCPSTGKRHMEGCPEFKTVAESQAWQMSRPDIAEQLGLDPALLTITPEQWKQLVPLESES
jgi:hypothetical protein